MQEVARTAYKTGGGRQGRLAASIRLAPLPTSDLLGPLFPDVALFATLVAVSAIDALVYAVTARHRAGGSARPIGA